MKKITIVFCLGLFLRLGYVLFFEQEKLIPGADYWYYDTIAMNLASGSGFSVNKDVPTIMKPPLYPFFLSIIYRVFGQNHTIVRIIQSVIDSLTCILIFSLAKKITSAFDEKRDKISFSAALIYTAHPVFIAYCGLLMTEVLFIFLFIAVLLVFLTAARKNDPKYFLAAGALTGVSALCRSTTTFFPVVLVFILLLVRSKNKSGRRPVRDLIRNSFLLLFSFAVILAPWTYRNYRHYGEFIPVSMIPRIWVYVSGSLAAGGSVENALDYCSEWSGRYPEPEVFVKGSYPPLQFNKEVAEKGMKLIRNNLQGYIFLVLKRPREFWLSSHSSMLGADQSVSWYIENRIYRPLLLRFGLLFINGLILLGALYGLKLLWFSNRTIFWVNICTFSYYNMQILLDSCPRLLLPVFPLLFILFSMGWYEFYASRQVSKTFK